MQRFVLLTIKSVYKFFMVSVLVGLMSFLGVFDSGIQSASADVSSPKQALEEIQKDQAAESPTQAYDEMTKIVEDPKVGIEKEYEKEEKEYFKSNPDSEGVVEQAKELVNKVTSSKGK